MYKITIQSTIKERQIKLDKLKEEIGQCSKCGILSKFRNKIAIPFGEIPILIMFIGEAPSIIGGNISGRCWTPTSKSGRLLSDILDKNFIDIENCYFSNICYCSPPHNRKPTFEEIRRCIKYKFRELRLIQPELVILLGKTAAENFLKFEYKRYKVYKIRDYYFVAFEHPAYILRQHELTQLIYRTKFKQLFNSLRMKWFTK